MKLYVQALFIAAVLFLPSALAAANTAVEPMDHGRLLTQLFLEGDATELHAAFSTEMVELMGNAAEFEVFRDDVVSQLGEETLVADETVASDSGVWVYERTTRFSLFPGMVLIQWSFDDAGTVVGFYLAPLEPSGAAPSDYLDYATQAALRLPFTGEWTVVWGGRTVEENYHAAYGDQRFAYDFLVVQGGSTHAGSGADNHDYYCFELPILAPAAGLVVAVVDGVPDNKPGEFGDDDTLGNHVIIDHGAGEYSFLAHFKNGSVAVAPGQRVATGDQIGACGNSGRSSEPHLHYHLQDTAEFGRGAGLPARFLNYVADDERVESGEPVQGQQVSGW